MYGNLPLFRSTTRRAALVNAVKVINGGLRNRRRFLDVEGFIFNKPLGHTNQNAQQLHVSGGQQ